VRKQHQAVECVFVRVGSFAKLQATLTILQGVVKKWGSWDIAVERWTNSIESGFTNPHVRLFLVGACWPLFPGKSGLYPVRSANEIRDFRLFYPQNNRPGRLLHGEWGWAVGPCRQADRRLWGGDMAVVIFTLAFFEAITINPVCWLGNITANADGCGLGGICHCLSRDSSKEARCGMGSEFFWGLGLDAIF